MWHPKFDVLVKVLWPNVSKALNGKHLTTLFPPIKCQKTLGFDIYHFECRLYKILLLIHGWLLLLLWDSVNFSMFCCVNFVSILVLQSSRWGRESWLFCFVCLPGVSWLLCGSTSRYYGFVCSLSLCFFLIILNYYFCLNDDPRLSLSYPIERSRLTH